jgi:hypothetical protein
MIDGLVLLSKLCSRMRALYRARAVRAFTADQSSVFHQYREKFDALHKCVWNGRLVTTAWPQHSLQPELSAALEARA